MGNIYLDYKANWYEPEDDLPKHGEDQNGQLLSLLLAILERQFYF